MSLKLVTPPASEPISLTEAKAHLRVEFSDDDALIGALIKAARGYTERFLGRALVAQTWDYFADTFPAAGAAIELPMPPCLDVQGAFYTASAGGSETELTTGVAIDLNGEPARVYLTGGSWPTIGANTASAVRVRFRAGYLDDSVSPPVGQIDEDIKAAIKLYLGTLYEHRETIVIGQTAVEMPWAAQQLLRFHRFDLSMA